MEENHNFSFARLAISLTEQIVFLLLFKLDELRLLWNSFKRLTLAISGQVKYLILNSFIWEFGSINILWDLNDFYKIKCK